MADLRYKDKNLLEEAFGMSSGYVLDFSDRTFEDFIGSILQFNVHEKYTGSKANKMRAMLKCESNSNVAKLLQEIADIYFKDGSNEQALAGVYVYQNKEERDKKQYYCSIQEVILHLKSNSNTIASHDSVNTYEHLSDFIKQAWDDLSNERYWEVITKSRTIIEITFKEICKRHTLAFENDINKTFTNIRKHFGMDAKNNEYPDYIKGLITFTANLVNNIAEARNKNSSSHAPEYKPKKHHAQLCLEQSISLMNFIISADEVRTVNTIALKNL